VAKLGGINASVALSLSILVLRKSWDVDDVKVDGNLFGLWLAAEKIGGKRSG
jgi:hypothetical protein